jgi:UDP-glucose 4-epimerase
LICSGRVTPLAISVKALVTGGAGFIGSHLVDALLADGHEVRVLDNFSTGHRRNLNEADVDVVEGDLRSFERVTHAARGIEVVFHEGALPSVPRSVQDPLTSNAVNVEGTLNVVLAARDHGIRRLVFASSSSVYGDAPGMPRREDGVVAPLAPYAVAKLAAEQYVLVANRVFDIEAVALRYFNVFGERQDPTSGYAAVIPKFLRQMLRGEHPTIYGDGSAFRDFTHVENVVAATMAAASVPAARGLAINIAMHETHTVNDLVAALNDVLSTSLEPKHFPPRPGDVPESVADISLASQVLNYQPSVDFATGLRRTAAWVSGREEGM